MFVFEQVIMGVMEWGYWGSDGEYYMHQYVKMAEASGSYGNRMSDDELAGLKANKRMWDAFTGCREVF